MVYFDGTEELVYLKDYENILHKNNKIIESMQNLGVEAEIFSPIELNENKLKYRLSISFQLPSS